MQRILFERESDTAIKLRKKKMAIKKNNRIIQHIELVNLSLTLIYIYLLQQH